jgi:hypothetical protein
MDSGPHIGLSWDLQNSGVADPYPLNTDPDPAFPKSLSFGPDPDPDPEAQNNSF